MQNLDKTKEQLIEELKLCAMKEAEWKRLMESIPDYVLKIDRDGVIRYINRIPPGSSDEDILGRKVYDFISPGNCGEMREALEYVLNNGDIKVFETSGLCLPGDWESRYFSNSLAPVFSGSEITGILQISTDITENKKNLNILRSERDFKNKLIQSTPMFFVAISSGGKTLLMNRSMLRALEYTEEEVLGADYINTFVPEDERAKLAKVFHRLTGSHAPTFNENHVVAKGGKKFLVEWHGVPIFNENGDFDHFFGIGLDVTRKLQVENELRTLKENLEVAVIKKAKDVLEAKDKAMRFEKLAVLGKLAGIVAHELRTPLGVIKNSVYFIKSKLEEQSTDDALKNHLDIIDAEVYISDRIIEDILTFSKIKEPVISGVSVENLIKEAVVKIMLPENIHILTKVQDNLPEALVDREQILLVLYNVITNGVQSMPNSGELKVTAHKAPNMIEIEVSDTGEGIPKINLDKIFEPLFTTKIRGTGLGLSVCKSIVNLNKGIIEVESEEGVGTTFKIGLPPKVNTGK